MMAAAVAADWYSIAGPEVDAVHHMLVEGTQEGVDLVVDAAPCTLVEGTKTVVAGLDH